MELAYMRRETEEWLRIAHEEYRSAGILLKEGLYRMVCYHAQQTVEKILKAILTENGIDFARTHNLLDLKKATDALGYDTDLVDEDAVFLGSVYRARYPAILGFLPGGDPIEEDAINALRIAEKVIRSAQSAFPVALS